MAGGPLAPSSTGPSPSHRKRKSPAPAVPEAAAAEEDEAWAEEVPIEELESRVADLGRRILEYRRAAAGRLLDAAASRLAALRPPVCLEISAELQSLPGTSAAEADKEVVRKLEILKSKTNTNIAALPKVLKRVEESTAGIEKLEKLNINVHPVFLRKR
ncbi:hypothetical protein ACP70R_011172 [Stipagrostis hirtigluma subsp. patula]